jgi:hypothetical protein
MLFFEEHPSITGIGVFVILTASYWLWRWIRFDESQH